MGNARLLRHHKFLPKCAVTLFTDWRDVTLAITLGSFQASPVRANGTSVLQEACCPNCGHWARYQGAGTFACALCGPFFRAESTLIRFFFPLDGGEAAESWAGQRRGIPVDRK